MPDQSLSDITEALRRFAAERDWEQFHSAKNLAAALSVEASEVLEHFQWLSEKESDNLSSEKRRKVALELADVLLYLLRLSDRLDVNLVSTAWEKIKINAEKYPAEQARGSHKKYSDL